MINENLDVLNHRSEEFQRISLLHACAELGIPQSAKILLDKQADINIQDVKGGTPLYMACQNAHKPIVKMLLDKQADVNIQDIEGATPLYTVTACLQGQEEISELLRQHGAV